MFFFTVFQHIRGDNFVLGTLYLRLDETGCSAAISHFFLITQHKDDTGCRTNRKAFSLCTHSGPIFIRQVASSDDGYVVCMLICFNYMSLACASRLKPLRGRPFNSEGAGGDFEKNFLQALVAREKLHAAKMK